MPGPATLAAPCCESSNPLAAASPSQNGAAIPPGKLGLRAALLLALQHHPDLASLDRARCVARALIRDAARLPNPTLQVDVEDWLGSGVLSGVRSLQLTVVLSQEVELGGKREARRRVARLASKAADWQLARKRLEVMASLTETFVRGLYAQARVRAAAEQVKLSERILHLFETQNRAGRILEAQVIQARIRTSLARIASLRAQRNLGRARLALAAHWGSSQPHFGALQGDLARLPSAPDHATLLRGLERHPAVRQEAAKVAVQQARVTQARAAAWPNLGLQAGYRWLNEPAASTMVVGLSVPLPLFYRNQGAVGAARHRLAGIRLSSKAQRQRRRSALMLSLNRLGTARREVLVLRDQVMPAARTAYDKVRQGMRLGRLGPLDVLTAQRALFDARERLLEALRDVHLALVAAKRHAGVLSVASATQSPRITQKR